MLDVWKDPQQRGKEVVEAAVRKDWPPREALLSRWRLGFCYELPTGVRWKNELMLTFFLHGRNGAYRLCRGRCPSAAIQHGTEVAGPRLSLTTQTRTIDPPS